MNLLQLPQRTKIRLLAAMGVILGIALAMLIRAAFNHAPAPEVVEMVAYHLDQADEQAMDALELDLEPIYELLRKGLAGSTAFAQDALGWHSKWKLVSGYVAGNDEHRRYLEERFAARLFAPEDLERALQQVVTTYVNQLNDVDAMLLVNLKADLEGISQSGLSIGIDRAALDEGLDAAIRDSMRAAEADFTGMVGRELASFVAGEVLTMASIKLATSAGILTAGASSGAVTFGAGLVVGLIVDAIIGWAIDEFLDPVGELSRQLREAVGQMIRLIILGNDEQPSLFERLADYGERRSEARNTAITSILLP